MLNLASCKNEFREDYTPDKVDVDRFELEDGETYTFSLFYANRNQDSSTFGVRTNLKLWQNTLMATATMPTD